MITIEFSIPVTDIINANGREHRMKVAGKAKRLRTGAAWHATAARRAQMPGAGVLMERATLTVYVGWQPLKRRRDRLNLGPTVKHCIDGMVDAKIIRDDDDLHLLNTMWESYDRSEAGLVWLRFEFESEDA